MGKKFIASARTLALRMLVLGLSPMTAADEGPSNGDAAQQWIEIRIENRAVVGDDVIRVSQDEAIALRWATDEAAELHIHGYDIRFDISPDAPAEIEFTAHATGRYAVTSHGFGDEHSHGHETLVYIEVHPN